MAASWPRFVLATIGIIASPACGATESDPEVDEAETPSDAGSPECAVPECPYAVDPCDTDASKCFSPCMPGYYCMYGCCVPSGAP